MSASQTIAAAEFKAKCLDILERLSTGELERVVVTKRGRPVAVLTPPPTPEDSVRGLYGCMEGSVIGPPDFDLTEPISEETWDAELGLLHR
jgi:prevent-host-death family protein